MSKNRFTVSTNDLRLVEKYKIIVKYTVNLKFTDLKLEPLLIDLEIIDPCTDTKF